MRTDTLYVTDLDGTLLNNGGFVSDASAQMLAELAEDGAKITVATARTPATVVPLLDGCGLRLPYIVMTGAALFDPTAGIYLDLHTMNNDAAQTAIELMGSVGINPFVYFCDPQSDGLVVYHNRELNESEQEFYEARRNLPHKRFTFNPSSGHGETILLFATGPTETLRAVADQLRSLGNYSVSCYPDIFRRERSLIEVFACGVSKANAIEQMRMEPGIGRVVVFGDNINDLPMMETADVAVAVANAFDPVKNAADIVIGPNYDDSVARFIADDFYS